MHDGKPCGSSRGSKAKKKKKKVAAPKPSKKTYGR